jgi:hypothetical protein
MLLTDARRPARTGPHGELIPMAEQDRSLWNTAQIAEGVDLITAALARGPAGAYQLQAAIAALYDEAQSADATDWPQIVALYELLLRLSDNPVVRLNHAVAVAMVRGSAPTSGWPGTTGCPRPARTCWRWPANARRPAPPTSPRRSGRATSRSSATCTPGPTG